MSKRHFLDDSYQPCSSKQRKLSPNTNWEICALCQTSLQCPAKSSKPPIGKGYVSLVENLIEFQSLGCMPLDLSLERLDNGHGLEATLKVNSAKWHKTCRLKFNATTLKRMKQKIITTETEASTSKVLTRSSVCCKLTVESVCFFYNEPAGSAGLHDVSTYQLHQNVRECALHLEDTELLAKLAPGDMIALEAKYHLKCLNMLYNTARQATRLYRLRHSFFICRKGKKDCGPGIHGMSTQMSHMS